MLKNRRMEEILNILKNQPHATVKELSERLYASPATIRRDILELEKRQLINKFWGGISLAGGHNRFVILDQRVETMRTQKNAVAKIAASLVKPGDAIFMDGSSTVISMIPFLQTNDLTVVTNSLRVAGSLATTSARVFLTGGQLQPKSMTFGGSIAENNIRSFHADKLFFSAAGIDKNGVISDFYETDIALRQEMIRFSKEQYFLCDSSKYGQKFLFKVTDITHITQVICEKELQFER